MSATASSQFPSFACESKEEEAVKERQQQKPEVIKECTYKTKAIQFLGRTTPIILQNDNGPCPLLAICNVLLLSNNLNLSPDITEVSQEKLLSLVAERLIDSNSNVDNKDAGYVENQCRNIADAIDLLPRLATGIDVNIKFRRTDDFEFTSECAIFDLLDIPLYHGWIVDPQDHETACAIGSKSYNAVMEELVALEARNMEALRRNKAGDCSVPSLLESKSFVDSPCSVPGRKLRKGDLDEEAEVLRVLKLSEAESRTSVGVENRNSQQMEPSLTDNGTSLSNDSGSKTHFESPKIDGTIQGQLTLPNDAVEERNVSLIINGSVASMDGKNTETPQGVEKFDIRSASETNARDIPNNVNGNDTAKASSGSLQNADSDSSSGSHRNVPGSEPLYEGKAILAKQANKRTVDDCNARPKDEITPQQGELIGNFLKNNASQFTFYGLFCLQEGLKERELCVFFRNNHFSTMFKYAGELYLLATDLGYINQPNLVWEKLNEVNGDTLFMTGNFKEFKVDDGHAIGTWDEQNAMATTADYIASIDSAVKAGMDLNSDLQLAIALQQQEFEEEPPPRPPPPPPSVGGSRLVTTTQRRSSSERSFSSSSSSSSPKRDEKSKDMCSVM